MPRPRSGRMSGDIITSVEDARDVYTIIQCLRRNGFEVEQTLQYQYSRKYYIYNTSSGERQLAAIIWFSRSARNNLRIRITREDKLDTLKPCIPYIQ